MELSLFLLRILSQEIRILLDTLHNLHKQHQPLLLLPKLKLPKLVLLQDQHKALQLLHPLRMNHQLLPKQQLLPKHHLTKTVSLTTVICHITAKFTKEYPKLYLPKHTSLSIWNILKLYLQYTCQIIF